MLIRHMLAALIGIGVVAICADDAVAQFKKKGKGGAGRSGWLSSLQAGKSQALATGKPMMVVIRCVP